VLDLGVEVNSHDDQAYARKGVLPFERCVAGRAGQPRRYQGAGAPLLSCVTLSVGGQRGCHAEEEPVPTIKPNPEKLPKKDDGKEEPNPIWGTHSDPGTSTTDQTPED
jgi:hypothetical protein